jgi:hypothetical protein
MVEARAAQEMDGHVGQSKKKWVGARTPGLRRIGR